MQRVEVDGIDDADNGGVDRAVFAFGGEARGAAGNDQHRFTKAGIDGIDGDEVAGFVAAFRIDGLHDEKFFSFEARILARGNNCADDARENHGKK